MSNGKMHADEVAIDSNLVRRLLAAQFPQWASLPVVPVASAGTDNALFRLGEEMVVRLPRIHWAAGQVEKEQAWLPKLAPHLPVAIPLPLAKGIPGAGYPWHWSVCRWLAGENPTADEIADARGPALELARFIRALQQIGATGGPTPGAHNSGRGKPLAARDKDVRESIDALQGLIDADAVVAAWERALHAPLWEGLPRWVHGDLSTGNLLVQQGHLSAVIDFGCLGVGDPAVDLLPAWAIFGGAAREAFRAALHVDAATWLRGRGWALSVALIALPYYLHTNPALVAASWRTLHAVMADPDWNH